MLFTTHCALASTATTVLAAPAPNHPHVDVHVAFDAWKGRHSKNYATVEEEATRKAIFTQTHKDIHIHNSDPTQSFKKGHNQFSDMTFDEYKAILTPFNVSQAPSARRDGSLSTQSIDWVKKGYVTPIKNQAKYGTCVIFSTMEMVEAYYYSQSKSLVSFSEQQVFDCYPTVSDNFNNCAGGDPNNCGGTTYPTAFEVINKMGDLQVYETNPYQGASCDGRQCPSPVGPTGQCSKDNAAWTFSAINVAEGNGEEKMSQDVLKTVLGVTVYAACQAWMQYESGILTSDSCGSMDNTDHAVVVVGYNYNNGQPYWIIKNHWDTNWGMNGYVHVAAGVNAFNIGTGTPYNYVQDVSGGVYPSGATTSGLPVISSAVITTTFIPPQPTEAPQTSDAPIDTSDALLPTAVPVKTVSNSHSPKRSSTLVASSDISASESAVTVAPATLTLPAVTTAASATPSPAASCSHDLCTIGAPLDATCGDCVATICAVDEYCCNNMWDSLCISVAMYYCTDVSCA